MEALRADGQRVRADRTHKRRRLGRLAEKDLILALFVGGGNLERNVSVSRMPVVLAVPATQHFDASKQALEAGKHVFVEKPMTLNVRDARELVELAEKTGRILMVGHLLEYHPAVQMLKELIQEGELGDVYYLYSQRVNLGIIRQDENALWSFAPHDVSTVLYLLDQEPDSVSARGECYLQEGVEDVVFVNLHFTDGKMAQLQLSWLDPRKIRKLTIVGSRKMAVFDDVES